MSERDSSPDIVPICESCGSSTCCGTTATARIIRIIESMDDPRSIRSIDCSDVFTPAAFEDWCDDLIAAIQEDGDANVHRA